MANKLILDSLEIRQFRTFQQLKIERLGRVNLIVGQNNVGKSCLLEALWLYARQGSPALIIQLLAARDESSSPSARNVIDLEDQVLAIKHLFYGRYNIQDQPEPIQIGSLGSKNGMLSITVGWYGIQVDKEGNRELLPLKPQEYDTVDNPILGLAVQIGKQPKVIHRLDRFFDYRWSVRLSEEPINIRCIFTSANGLNPDEIGQLWDSIALTDLQEDIVLPSLRLITPKVEGIALVDNPLFKRSRRDRERIPIVKISGLNEPIPLRSQGEGMNRIFGLALALANAREGLLLIDEIESGLHYSVQPDLWRLIFEAAHRLNVQVFATTHSWDCIDAFREAAQEHQQDEGLIISLRRKKGQEDKVVAILIDKKELGIVTREQIEVR
jgi:predicted ATPase